jgi:hypothetical protein
MANVSDNDDEMTADEFDARVAAGPRVELNVSLRRPVPLYRATVTSMVGVSAERTYGLDLRAVAMATGQPASHA